MRKFRCSVLVCHNSGSIPKVINWMYIESNSWDEAVEIFLRKRKGYIKGLRKSNLYKSVYCTVNEAKNKQI